MTSPRFQSAILFLVPFLGLFLMRMFLDFNGLYGQDAHRYFQFVGELDAYFRDGAEPGEFHWPVLFPLSGWVLKTVFDIGASMALQLVSALSLAISSLVVFRILKGNESRGAFTFTLVFLLFCPQMLISSSLCMSDLYSTMWVVLCWYCWFKLANDSKWTWGLWMAMFGAFATISRYPAVLLVMVPLLVTFYKLIRKYGLRAILMPLIFLAGCLPEFIIQSTADRVLENDHLIHWNFVNLFKSQFETIDGTYSYRFPNVVYITYPLWHSVYFLIGFGFALMGWLKFGFRKIQWVLLFSIVMYLLFLGGIETQSRRFFMLVFPLILIFIYQSGFGEAAKGIHVGVRNILAGILIILQLGIGVYYGKSLVEMNHFEQRLAAELKPFEGRKLYAFYWDVALQSYGCRFEYFNLWQKPVDASQPGDLVLFNPEGLMEQWQGSLLMDNWGAISKDDRLKLMYTWENGWKLYEVR